MTNSWVKCLLSGVLIMGTGWTLYCLSPAGAAEREYTRKQKEYLRQMNRKIATDKSD